METVLRDDMSTSTDSSVPRHLSIEDIDGDDETTGKESMLPRGIITPRGITIWVRILHLEMDTATEDQHTDYRIRSSLIGNYP